MQKKQKKYLKQILTITDLIPEENENLQEIKRQIMENIMILKVKLYSAERMKLWDLKMEKAALIRKNARELVVMYHSLKMFGFEEAEYYKIIRQQLEEFRLLFREWVADFNPKHFITDDWGHFNPPGISNDYEQKMMN